MRKRLLLIFTLLILLFLAVGERQAGKVSESKDQQEVKVEEKKEQEPKEVKKEDEEPESKKESESKEESKEEEPVNEEIALRENKTSSELFHAKRLPWTNYEKYAKLDEEGYAYYMHADPDVSSEIFPLNDDSSSKILLFTFDDFPAEPESYVLDMAKLLKEKDVNAIFLANGMFMQGSRGKEIVKKIYDMGFEVGNHTTNHPNLRDLSYDEQYDEVKKTSDLIKESTGEAPRWFRPPFGLFNMDTINICNELGMQLMTWNFGYDWMEEYQDGKALAEISLNTEYLRPGANILMHDRSWTLEALEKMIDGYRELGYEIVDPLLIKAQENSTTPLQE